MERVFSNNGVCFIQNTTSFPWNLINMLTFVLTDDLLKLVFVRKFKFDEF